jgi:hypothetical protein
MNFRPGQECFDALAVAETADLERPFDCRWRRPRIAELGVFREEEEVIRWLPAGEECSPGPGMLEDFVLLFGKSSEAILAYAKRWGVLGICEEHAFPIGHGCPPRGGLKVSLGQAWKYSDAELLFQQDGDPVSAWRQFSEAAYAVLAIHAHLNAGQVPDEQLWKLALKPGPNPAFSSVLGDVPWTAAPWWNRDIDSQFLIKFCINRWMRNSGVLPQLDPKDLSIRFASAGLFGAIAVQLMLVVSGSQGWVICSNAECHRVYASSRRPKSSQKHYCLECRAARMPKRFADCVFRRCE